MRKLTLLFGAALAIFLIGSQPLWSQTPINVQIGTQHFTNGQNSIGTFTFDTAVAGQPAPFNTFCGSDLTANCSATWTFHYTVPAGFSVGSATFDLGIYDIDSAAPGNQVASFTLDGTNNLTGLLNIAANGLDGGTGAPNLQYDVLAISIPSADFSALLSGTATFALTLQGPGLAVPTILNPTGQTARNGAGLDFSSLDITPTPEPVSWLLFLTGVLCFGIMRFAKKPA